MIFTGIFKGVTTDWTTGEHNITFSISEKSALAEIEHIKDCAKLHIEAKPYRKKRSLDANAMLWACLGEIARASTPPLVPWDVYLFMLKRYGQYTYICVKPNMVEAMKRQWREIEVVGDIDINGKQAVQLLCYFGSSTYDSKEFSVLLDGVVSEMKEMGLQPPPSKDMQRAIEQWEKKHEKTS
jgi:hypothetical protein